MKIGSKKYQSTIFKLKNFGIALFFFGIAAHFTSLTKVANVMLIAGIGMFGIAQIFNLITPQIDGDYEWEKVYPELNEED